MLKFKPNVYVFDVVNDFQCVPVIDTDSLKVTINGITNDITALRNYIADAQRVELVDEIPTFNSLVNLSRNKLLLYTNGDDTAVFSNGKLIYASEGAITSIGTYALWNENDRHHYDNSQYIPFSDVTALKLNDKVLSALTEHAKKEDIVRTMGGVEVAEIAPSAFNHDIQGVFKNCKNLKAVNLQDSGYFPNDSHPNIHFLNSDKAFYKCKSMSRMEGNWGNVHINGSTHSMFEGCPNLKTLPPFNITNKDSVATFKDCRSLESLNLCYNRSEECKVFPYPTPNLSQMFEGCAKLKSIACVNQKLTQSSFHGASDIDATKMFKGCKSLETIDLGGNLQMNMAEGVFEGCESLKEIKADSVVSISDCPRAFANCDSLTFQPKVITEVHPRVFNGCKSLTKVALSHRDEVNGRNAFKGCKNLESYEYYDLDLNVDNGSDVVINAEGMFNGCAKLTSVHSLTVGYREEGTNLAKTFKGCKTLTDVNAFLTPQDGVVPPMISSLQETFSDCENLSNIDLSHLNMGGVNTLQRAFKGCKALTSVSAGEFTTISSQTPMMNGFGEVRNLESMFEGCSSLPYFHSIFSTASVLDFRKMFSGCTSLANVQMNLDLSGIGVRTDINPLEDMFKDCGNMTNIVLRISNWGDVPAVLDLSDLTKIAPNSFAPNVGLVVSQRDSAVSATIVLPLTAQSLFESEGYVEQFATLGYTITFK